MNETNVTDNFSAGISMVYPPAALIWKIFCPILIMVGTISNTLTLIVFSRPNMRSNNTVFYMIILAIGDLLVLTVGLSRTWIKYTFDYDIRSYSEFVCKGHSYFVHLLLHFTTYTLVAVTIDRCVCVCSPFKSKRMSTFRNARFTMPAIGIFLLITHTFFIVGFKLEDKNGETVCMESENIDWKTWSYFDIILFCFIPFTIMIVCDICITRKIATSDKRVSKYGMKSDNGSSEKHAQRKRHTNELSKTRENKGFDMGADSSKADSNLSLSTDNKRSEKGGYSPQTDNSLSMSTDNKSSENGADSSKTDNSVSMSTYNKRSDNGADSSKTGNSLSMSTDNKSSENGADSSKTDNSLSMSTDNKRCSKTESKTTAFSTKASTTSTTRSRTRPLNLTAMLLAISFAYLVLTIPIGVRIVTKSIIQSEETRQLTWAIVNVLRFTNNVIHFFLYCLTGSKFRGELLKICRCERN